MRRPTRQPSQEHVRSAAATGLTILAVNPKLLLIVSLLAVAADVVADRRTVRVDGAVQDHDDRLPKQLGLFWCRIAGPLGRMKPHLNEKPARLSIALPPSVPARDEAREKADAAS